MRSFALAIIASAVAASPGLAADLPAPALPPQAPATYAPPPPPFTWTGIYVGANGGYGLGNWSDGLGDSFSPSGALAGGTVGANYQIQQFVLGLEGDIDWSSIKWSQSASSTFAGPFGGTVSGSLADKNEYLSTFAARFGFAADRALFYAKGGGALTNEDWSVSVTNTAGAVATGSSTDQRFGWMAGAGIEYAITDMITLKAEYNYIDFGSNNDTLTISGGGLAPTSATVPSKLTMNVFKGGVNFLFH